MGSSIDKADGFEKWWLSQPSRNARTKENARMGWDAAMEAAAKVCDARASTIRDSLTKHFSGKEKNPVGWEASYGAESCAEAIRALIDRGQT